MIEKEQFNLFEKNFFNNEKKREHRFAEEMRKPEDKWSKDFKFFLDKERRKKDLENQQDKIIEILKEANNKKEDEWTEKEKDAYKKREEFIELQERNKEDIIDMYLNDLEIEEDKIPLKKILDIGCGREAKFVKYIIEKLDSKNVYGVDVDLEKEMLQKYPHNLYKQNFYETLPINNLDLIIARATICNEDLTQKNFLENILNSLSEKGELRVYPIFKNHFESDHKEALKKESELIKILNKLSEQFNFDYSLKVKEISLYGKDKYPASKNLLIIKKQK